MEKKVYFLIDNFLNYTVSEYTQLQKEINNMKSESLAL